MDGFTSPPLRGFAVDGQVQVFGAYAGELLPFGVQAFAGVVRQLAALLTDLAHGPPATTRAAGCGPDRRRVLAPLQPAVISLLRQLAPETAADTRRRHAALIADAFWRLFNRPAVISLLRQLPAGTAAVRDESAYWRRVLHYCRQGNLQAVLDEQWHLLWDQRSWSEDASADETAGKCARKLVQVVHPAPARVHAEFFRAEQGASGATVERDEIRVRTVFALRFGHVRTDDGDYISQDAVRAAFNSPFRPFVLTSVDRAGGHQLPTSPKRRETDRRIVPHLSSGNVRLQQGRFRVDPVRDTQARPSSTVLTVRPWFASRRGRSTPATVTAG